MKNNQKSAEVFIRMWQAAKNFNEVCKKMGIDLKDVKARQRLSQTALKFRRKGVELKHFRGGGISETLVSTVGVDFKELAKLVK